MATQGRCVSCNIRVIFAKAQKVSEVLCPMCHGPLSRTTHLFSTGDTVILPRDGSINSIMRANTKVGTIY